MRSLNARPLVELLRELCREHSSRIVAQQLEVDRRTVERYKNLQHISLWKADAICTALGRHPSEVFGQHWSEEHRTSLSRILAEKDMSQAELSQRSGVSREFINALCNGRRVVSRAANVAAIAWALEIGVDELGDISPDYLPLGPRGSEWFHPKEAS